MLTKISSFLILLITLNCHAGLEISRDIIKDPVISRRCKALLRERQEKIEVRQKLNAMLLRNSRLIKQLNTQQKITKQRLKLNHTQIKNNLRLTGLKIKSMEENIIRKGCPGITL